MKQIVAFLSLSFLCAFIGNNTSSNDLKTEVVVSVDDFSDSNAHKNIIQEFLKINGVSRCEASINNKTIAIQFDDSKFKINDIYNVLNKWECNVIDMSFQSLANSFE